MITMRCLTALRGARQLLGLAAIARGAFWNKKPAQDAAAAPDYVLTEEHHHVLPHLLALVAEGKVRKRATLVHLDSHHDAGLPSNWNHEDKEHDTQLAHTHINNFLFALGLLEAVEHVIFVEPPWSRQCVSLHNRTKALRLGFIEGAPRVSYDDGRGRSRICSRLERSYRPLRHLVLPSAPLL